MKRSKRYTGLRRPLQELGALFVRPKLSCRRIKIKHQKPVVEMLEATLLPNQIKKLVHQVYQILFRPSRVEVVAPEQNRPFSEPSYEVSQGRIGPVLEFFFHP